MRLHLPTTKLGGMWELEVIELQFQNQIELTKHSAHVWQQEQQFLRALQSFPLKLTPEQVYEAPESLVIIPKHGVIPAFDGLLTDAAIDPSLLARIKRLDADLSWFLQQSGYLAVDPIHGTRFLEGCWSNHNLIGQAATVALHSFLKGRATLFTEYQALDNEIWFNVAYWGLGDTTYNYFTVATFPFHPAEGLVVHRRLFALQALAAGYVADMQAITRKLASPLLPPRLPTILGDAMDVIIERVVSNVLRGYIRALHDRAETAPDRVAQLALDIAAQLAQGARENHAERFLQRWAQQFLAVSLQMFLEYRGGDPGRGSEVSARRCLTGVDSRSKGAPEFVAIDEQPYDEIVHALCLGEAQRTTH